MGSLSISAFIIDEGDAKTIADKVSGPVHDGIEECFAEALWTRQQAESSVRQGLAQVTANLRYIQLIEGAEHQVFSDADLMHRELVEAVNRGARDATPGQ